MKINKELASLGVEDLQKRLKELKTGLIKDNAQIAVGTVPKNSGKIRVSKKTIARILAILHKKETDKKKGGS